jgi:hypothetical protein
MIVDELCKILRFFNLALKPFFFSSDLVVIEDQLILISYDKVGLKNEGPK